jgi:hypothetical protein
MFQFAGFASPTYVFSGRYRRSGGLPHSEIHGSKPARGSPWLIATCCVLHRLSVPRHPPDALHTLVLTAFTRRVNRLLTNAPRAGESPQGTTHQPARIRQRCIVMTQPAVSPKLRRRPCRVILGHSFSSHVKDPIPARKRISAFSLIEYHVAGSLKVTKGHCPSLCPSSWWRRTGSNRRPHACKARALPTELRPHGEGSGGTVVGQGRLELPTSRLSSARSNQLSY